MSPTLVNDIPDAAPYSNGNFPLAGKVTVPKFVARKQQGGPPIAMVTAYDYPTAGLFDAAGVDSILVGDSLGMVIQGRDSTLPVTLDQMIYHGEMVTRATKRALVIVDLPFLSYHVSREQAIESAGRVLKETNASAVKLEGGVKQTDKIRAVVDAEIPVVGHIGLQPQSVRRLGSIAKVQRDEDALLRDAHAVAEAGAFAIVLELIPLKIAQRITRELSIPTIGIGAGPHCDGQVLVGPDLLGLTPNFQPRFLKRYAELHEIIHDAAIAYVEDVHARQFPTVDHSHE